MVASIPEDPGDERLEFYVSNNTAGGSTQVMTLRGDGNVGIGTTFPQHLLDVVGAAGATGTLLSFVAKIENTKDNNAERCDGLLVKAGHNTYNPSIRNSMIEFQTPSGLYIGRVRQNSASSVSYVTTSDIRLKENINPTRFGLKDLLKIDVSDYTYKSDPSNVQTGFIAQQLHTAYPPAVGVGGEDVKTNPWEVAYGSLTPLLVQAVQEQQAIIDAQQAEIEAMKAENLLLKAQNVEMKTTDTELKAEIENIKSMLGMNNEIVKTK